ncbi:hypothetical protein TNCV_3846061 [Trichonephila clavipes]|nr:hypothetical protein TNCV_3846061 [Trichonephila clavipes]
MFQRLHRPFRETSSFHLTRQDADGRRAVCSPSLKGSILNVLVDKQELLIIPYVSHQTACRVERKSLTPLPFSERTDYFLRLPVGGSAMCHATRLHSSSPEELQLELIDLRSDRSKQEIFNAMTPPWPRQPSGHADLSRVQAQYLVASMS